MGIDGAKTITVGLHKEGPEWSWYGYNGTTERYTGFPSLDSTQNPNGPYSFIQNMNGAWQLFAGADVPRPYICESRACDADHYCDLSANKKLFKRPPF